MTRRVADDLLDVLVQAGVHRVYGLVGDSLNAFSDAVRRSGGSANGGIDWVHVHNEESAAWAASAEAQLTGRLAVCAGSCGPGNTHLIQGVMDAHRSGASVLALATQIPSRQVGSGYFQETKPEALFAQTSYYCETVAHPDQVVRLTRSAVQNAVGKQGAAVLVLPGDILAEHSDGPVGQAATVNRRPLPMPDDDAIAELADRIRAAEKIAIFAGIGCTDARQEVLELAGLLNAPIGHTLRGKDVLQYDNPFDVGMTGLLGYGSCYRALHDADLVPSSSSAQFATSRLRRRPRQIPAASPTSRPRCVGSPSSSPEGTTQVRYSTPCAASRRAWSTRRKSRSCSSGRVRVGVRWRAGDLTEPPSTWR
jgi:pyruvate dehydrogenase (quinone)